MYGDELALPAALDVDCLGEGVRGIRPPAVREEKSPLWDLSGVDTDAVAMMIDSDGYELQRDLRRGATECVDRGSKLQRLSNEFQEALAKDSWVC